MKITFENIYKKHYLELLPAIAIYHRLGETTLNFSWLFFSLTIEKSHAKRK